MAKEMEAKIALNEDTGDQAALIALVKSLGGIEKYSRFEINIFYDTSSNSLDKKGEVLRLRQEKYADGTNDISMTFKGKRSKGKLKVRDEHEFKVSDFEQARSLLSSLGYEETFRFEKRRRTYSLDGCLIEFDTLPYLGEFVEIEGKNEKKINALLEKLGLQDASLITEGYGGLLREDAKKQKRTKKVAEFVNV